MAHEYSVEIHNYISEKISVAEEKKKKAEKQNDSETQQFCEGQLTDDPGEIRFHEGRIEILSDFRFF